MNNKLAVIVCGWHYSHKFYEDIISQKIPKGWRVDFFVISHRHPENENVIKEKKDVRNYTGKSSDDLFLYFDKVLYETLITEKDLVDLGWTYIEKPNTYGDMIVFNQWSEDYDYTEYDLILLSHDDNLILSDSILVDTIEKDIELYKPIIESRYGMNKQQFKLEVVKNKYDDWYFLENGYSEYIPKAIMPRGSFSFYKKELIDLLPDNKFEFDNIELTRVGKTDSPKNHMDLNDWNTSGGNLRNFFLEKLPNLELVDKTRWFSNTKRVSKYLIEGERGFIHSNRTSEHHYFDSVKKLFEA